MLERIDQMYLLSLALVKRSLLKRIKKKEQLEEYEIEETISAIEKLIWYL